MITQETIDSLYRRFRRRPARLEDRHLGLLVDYALDTDALDMDDERLEFTRMESDSPFRTIDLERVHGVADLPEALAVVLANSIVFINKRTLRTYAHIKALPRPGLLRRIFRF